MDVSSQNLDSKSKSKSKSKTSLLGRVGFTVITVNKIK